MNKDSFTAPGRVVLFNGPPSVGKTSLLRAMINQLESPWYHLSLDEFRSGIAERWWISDRGELFERLVAAYLGALRQVALEGIDVLAEAVVTPARRALYDQVFGSMPLLLISVRCSLDVAIQRERSRIDRRSGPLDMSAHDFAAVYSGMTYDMEIDSAADQPPDLADLVRANLDQLEPSTFASHLIANHSVANSPD